MAPWGGSDTRGWLDSDIGIGSVGVVVSGEGLVSFVDKEEHDSQRCEGLLVLERHDNVVRDIVLPVDDGLNVTQRARMADGSVRE